MVSTRFWQLLRLQKFTFKALAFFPSTIHFVKKSFYNFIVFNEPPFTACNNHFKLQNNHNLHTIHIMINTTFLGADVTAFELHNISN